jgi:hypothetical protein
MVFKEQKDLLAAMASDDPESVTGMFLVAVDNCDLETARYISENYAYLFDSPDIPSAIVQALTVVLHDFERTSGLK